MKIKTYRACNDCIHYLSTGDSSAIQWQHESEETFEETLTTIDATQEALSSADNLDYWLESALNIPTLMQRCQFCNKDDTVSQAVQAVVKS